MNISYTSAEGVKLSLEPHF